MGNYSPSSCAQPKAFEFSLIGLPYWIIYRHILLAPICLGASFKMHIGADLYIFNQNTRICFLINACRPFILRISERFPFASFRRSCQALPDKFFFSCIRDFPRLGIFNLSTSFLRPGCRRSPILHGFPYFFVRYIFPRIFHLFKQCSIGMLRRRFGFFLF